MMFPKLKDVIPITNGVFGHMNYTFRAEVSKEQLDYLLMASFAKRNPAPVIDLLYDEETEEPCSRELTNTELTKLAAMMLAYYKPRWDKLGDIYDVEYDPIHNYLDQWEDESSGVHGETVVLDSSRTDDLDTTVAHDFTRTDNLDETTTRHMDETVERKYDATNGLSVKETEKRNYSTERSYTNFKEKDRRDWDETTTRLYDADNPLKTGKSGTETTKQSHENTDSVKAFNSGSWQETDKNAGGKANNESELSFSARFDTTTGKYSDTVKDGADGSLKTKSYEGTYKDTVKDDPTNGSVTDTVTKGSYKDTTTDGEDGSVTDKSNTGTQRNAGSETTTGSNTREIDETTTTGGDDHREREGKHFGNIGNLTSQKMLKEEIELWKWNYVQSILEDARDFLTLPVYLN